MERHMQTDELMDPGIQQVLASRSRESVMTKEPDRQAPEGEELVLPGEITLILQELNEGNRAALNEIIPLAYQQLRSTAQHYLSSKSSANTLQPTALIHEVYLKLFEGKDLYFKDRKQFFWFAGFLMRRVLIDSARARKSLKRGADDVVVSFDESRDVFGVSGIDLPTLLALDKLLNRLAELDARQSQIVQLRFFAGMSLEEIGEIMSISSATIKREWRTAKLWLARELKPKKVTKV